MYKALTRATDNHDQMQMALCLYSDHQRLKQIIFIRPISQISPWWSWKTSCEGGFRCITYFEWISHVFESRSDTHMLLIKKMAHHMWCNLGKSVWIWTCDIFSLFYLTEMLIIWGGTSCWKSHLNWTSSFKVMSNWRKCRLKAIENKRNSFLFLAISHN